jgi:hypothetical protein
MALLITDDLQVDMRIGVGLAAVRRDFFTGLGISRRW